MSDEKGFFSETPTRSWSFPKADIVIWTELSFEDPSGGQEVDILAWTRREDEREKTCYNWMTDESLNWPTGKRDGESKKVNLDSQILTWEAGWWCYSFGIFGIGPRSNYRLVGRKWASFWVMLNFRYLVLPDGERWSSGEGLRLEVKICESQGMTEIVGVDEKECVEWEES